MSKPLKKRQPRGRPPGRNHAQQTTDLVLEFIQNYIAQQGYAPSMAEIGEAVFLSRAAVLRHIDRLEAQGIIERQHGQARTITLLE